MRLRVMLGAVLLAVLSQSRLTAAQQLLPSDAAKDFCQLDAGGKRLSEAGIKAVAQKLLLAERAWQPPEDVIVVSDCSVRPLTSAAKDSSAFVVDYHVLARLDSSLFLTRLPSAYPGSLATQSERFSVVLTDTHSELGSDGEQHQVKGQLEWRIKLYPSEPHVSVNAAMNYVRMMSYHAKDIRAKMNARKTLAELQQMLAPPPVNTQVTGPEAVLFQFIEMQMGGIGSQVDAADQLSTFLVHPESGRGYKIGVARAYAVKKTTLAGNKATVSVEYGVVGEIDPQLRFTSLGERGAIVQRDYRLLLDNKYSVPAYGGQAPTEFVGPSRWRIEEVPDEQWVSITTAIKSVTQMRDSTRDPSIRTNADKTLSILKGLH